MTWEGVCVCMCDRSDRLLFSVEHRMIELSRTPSFPVGPVSSRTAPCISCWRVCVRRVAVRGACGGCFGAVMRPGS